jgi:type I restriction enzyme S subunit
MSEHIDASKPRWRDVTFGELLTHRRERGQNDDRLLSVTAQRGVVPHAEAGRRDTSNADKSAYWRVYPGDIAYNSMRMWQGVSGRSRYFGIVSPAYTVCAPTDLCDPAFAAYLLKQPRMIAAFRNRSQGLVSDTWNLKYGAFSSIYTRVPGKSEQRCIAEILHTLDEAARATDQLIAKLKQTKAGLLHDLMTRGIDQDGQLRDPRRPAEFFSDRELGLLPRGWTSRRFAELAPTNRPHLKTGPFGSALKGVDWVASGVPVVTIGALGTEGIITDELLFISERKAAELAPYALDAGDIVFSRVADVGRSIVIRGDQAGWIMSSNLMRIALDESAASPAYIHHALTSCPAVRQQIRANVNASGRDVATGAILNRLVIPIPPLEEQLEIVARVEAGSAAIRTHAVQLHKLRQLNAGLMDDLLTGRVRVNVDTEDAG